MLDERKIYEDLKTKFAGANGDAYREAAMSNAGALERYMLDAQRLQELERQFAP